MEDKKFCYDYPRPAVTTDCVVYGYNDKSELLVLLIERRFDPFKGLWAFPGGFLNMDESAEQCAKRELLEETGIKVDQIQQLYTASGVERDPRGRVISIVFIAKVDMSVLNVVAGDDASNAKWFNTRNIPQMAFDHNEILAIALKQIFGNT